MVGVQQRATVPFNTSFTVVDAPCRIENWRVAIVTLRLRPCAPLLLATVSVSAPMQPSPALQPSLTSAIPSRRTAILEPTSETSPASGGIVSAGIGSGGGS